ncbi:FxSxx-COOH system tetratricopeptide repeat protein [Streptomyces sp. NBC_00892]|uniref:FxSxx-COOH system tetratricopeptide repeat protein n=1 Tax=Streptomyces sp. NBC_00892 TaxID=2975861 RepID=UPI00225741AE|nr:FxSxx-COOH system tetratricopeptide repeat protein [Streptomyces sp. NBC_00892]MCX4902509.1 FxSxx-COOH system tetratricopeptide repeat protein [Streptomyces sp. NBC_00892]
MGARQAYAEFLREQATEAGMNPRKIEDAFKEAQRRQEELTAQGATGRPTEPPAHLISAMSYSKSHIDRLFKAQADPVPPWPFTLQFLKITSPAAGITHEEHKRRCNQARALLQAITELTATPPTQLPAPRTATTDQPQDTDTVAVLRLEVELERTRHTETRLRYALRDHDVLQSTLLQIISTLREIIAGNDAREAHALADARLDEAARLRDETHRALDHKATAQQEADRTATRMRVLEDLWTRARIEAQRLARQPGAVNFAPPHPEPGQAPQPLLATDLLTQPVLDDIAAALDKAHEVSEREEAQIQVMQRIVIPGNDRLQPADELAVLLASTRLPSADSRRSALLALTESWLHLPETKEAALRLMADPQEQVREAAVEALGVGWPGDEEARQAVLVQSLSLETYVSDAALDAVDATLRKAGDVLGREQEAVQEAAEDVGWTTPPAPSFAEQHMTVVRGHVVRSPDDLPESQPALAPPDSGRRRLHGLRLPVRNSLPPRNRHFTGREHLLGTLREAFSAAGQVAACVLTGMGGCGKTQLAAEYVHQTMSHYDLVWWIPAESRDTAREHLAALAPALGLVIGPSHETRIRAVQEELSRRDGLRWLIVFDNADDPEGIHDLVPTGPGHVLITSRQQGWNAETVAQLSVPEYARQESIDHFLSRVPALRDADADVLAEMLGDLPLAVEQAAVWLAETAMPVHEYVTLFRQKAAELAELEVEVPASYPKSVSKAWTISMNRLEHTRPQALVILKLGAFFDPSGIPLTLLQRSAHAAWEADPETWQDSLQELQRYALVRFDHRRGKEGEDTSDAGFMSMHRLVQAVVRDRLSEDEQRTLSRMAQQALAVADPGNPSDPEQWPMYAELIPHLDASGALDSDDPGLDAFRRNCLRYLYTTRG